MIRGRAVWILAGLAVLAVAWLAAPAAPPLYDGLPLPNQPYRYLEPPLGVNSKPPTGYDQTLPVTAGTSPAVTASTVETPPQVQLIALAGAFTLPSGATAMRVTITAIPEPERKPTDGAIDGNVYRIAVAAGDTPATITPGALVTVVLEGTGRSGIPRVEELIGGRWTVIDTQVVGTGQSLWAANIPALGDLALVLPGASPLPRAGAGTQPSSGTATTSGGSAGTVVLAVVIVVVLVLIGAGLGAVRVGRSRRARATVAGPRPGGRPGGGTPPGGAADPRREPPRRDRPPKRRRR